MSTLSLQVPQPLSSQLNKLRIHDHTCSIYSNHAQQFATIATFMKLGLERNEKCIYILDESTPEMIIKELGAVGVDVPLHLERGSLVLYTSNEAYLRLGYFSVDAMISFWNDRVREATQEGYSGIRVTGEMTWALRSDVDIRDVIEYEARRNTMFPHIPVVAMCQYNAQRFDPAAIKAIIHTHPFIVYGETLARNYYYIPPEEFLPDCDGSLTTTRLLNRIVEHEKSHQELSRSEQLYKTVVNDSDDAIITKDTGGIITSWNQAAETLYGYSSEEMIGKHISTLVPPERTDEIPEIMTRLLRGERVPPYETARRRKDGTQVDVSLCLSPLIDEDGNVAGASSIARDITALKRAEAELRQLTVELELRVEARTRELLESNQELESFCYSVSHDLRAPLRAMDGFVKIIMEDFTPDLPPALIQNLTIISDNAVRMGHLIDDLLSFSRTARQELRCSPVNMKNLTSATWSEFQEQCAGRQVEMTIQDMPVVSGDPSMIKQVLVNLLSNAVKFTRSCPEARIEIGNEQRNGERVFYVRDNGVGFDMRYVDKLFKPFQRLHKPRDYEGTGIGLAIVQRIIRKHGGGVWAESEVGKGTTVFFSLPNHEVTGCAGY